MTITAEVAGVVAALRAEVATLHAELPRWELVVWTAGNVSARVPGHDLLVIKPSGVGYDELTPEAMVVTDLEGNLVDGDRSPSSDTAAHAYVYEHMPEVGGVVHTHSTYATAWAARGEAIPCVLTMMADEFGGEIPIGPFALIGDDSVGRGIVETLRGHRSPAVLMQNHGAVHHRTDRQGGGQGGGDVRGGRPDRAHRPPARRTARHRASRHRLAVRPLPERLRPDGAEQSGSNDHDRQPRRAGSSPEARASTGRRPSPRSSSSPAPSSTSSTTPAPCRCR